MDKTQFAALLLLEQIRDEGKVEHELPIEYFNNNPGLLDRAIERAFHIADTFFAKDAERRSAPNRGVFP